LAQAFGSIRWCKVGVGRGRARGARKPCRCLDCQLRAWNLSQRMAYSSEEVEKVVASLEQCAERQAASKGATVKLRACERDLLTCAEAGRNLLLEAVKGDKALLEDVFGGTCEHINRLRVVIDAVEFSDMHKNDARWNDLNNACKTVEEVLQELGLYKPLQRPKLQPPEIKTFKGLCSHFSPGDFIHMQPECEGGAVVSFTIEPMLPQGLSLDGTTGTINGQLPSGSELDTTFTVTAHNEAGETKFDFTLNAKVTPPAQDPLVEAPAEAAAEAPAESPAEAPAQAPAEAPAEAAAETPAGSHAEVLAGAPTEAFAEALAEAPAGTPAEAPAEASATAPAEASAGTPAEAPAEASATAPTEAPAGTPAETPAPASAAAHTEAPAEAPADEVQMVTEMIRTGKLWQLALQTFRRRAGTAGCLQWNSREIVGFILEIFEALGIRKPTEHEMYAMYTRFDTDGSWSLDEQECLSMIELLVCQLAGVELDAHRDKVIASVQKQDIARYAASQFKAIDVNGNGRLEWNNGELRTFIVNVCSYCGLPELAEPQMLEMCLKFDTDKDGCLNQEDCRCLVEMLSRSMYSVQKADSATCCGNGHVMHLFNPLETKYACNVCRHQLDEHMVFWHCAPCDYDLCISCSKQRLKSNA